jgi:hypothetical protein
MTASRFFYRFARLLGGARSGFSTFETPKILDSGHLGKFRGKRISTFSQVISYINALMLNG